MSKRFMRNGMVSALDSRWTGQEPTWEGASEWTDEKIYHTFTRALDFYGYYLDLEDYIPIILEYLKNENPKDKTSLDNIKKSPRCVEIIILGKLARMINLGMPICHSGKNYKKKINSYLKTISDNVLLLTVEKETVKKGPSIFDIMQTKLRYGVIVHLDTMLDKWIRNNTVDVNKINVTSLLQSVGAPVNALGCVTTWFETQRSELIEARDKKCSQIVEAYSHLSKPAIKRRIKLLDEMLLDVDVYRSSKKSSRKPRVKKQKSADKLVKSLKYLKSSSEYGIVSTNPMKLIGSEKAYIFNEKYRRLTVLVQSDKNGLMVKGTTILDFHDDESYSTTLRKPKEILSAISTKTERQITNIMNKLTTKKNKANGRVSSNTLIVKA
tara:strand:- start:2999 stop:4144 length:1146 start_codon:yes stop_codon:yes gene_type:complete